ncbi:MerR family transcriptional regulator [Jeotgalibaca porci]|uniref:MerR family transcriptional regulator n=2 Tax=Jeotgalibaca porci TaxID=1868793 RepID=A0A6G7WGM4_9LACT|nr:MerR family transcriptional regulator [Jeotgalibaca porci]
MRMNDVVIRTGLSKDTIRYYEKLGLVSPSRDEYARRYNEKDIERLSHIQKLKHLDYSLKEIQQLVELDERLETIEAIETMSVQDRQNIEKLLADKIKHTQHKIGHLNASLGQLLLMHQKIKDLPK